MHWTLVLALVIAAWLALSVGGGLLIGRLVGAVSRLLRPRRIA